MGIDSLEKELRNKECNVWRCADSYSWDLIKNTNLLAFEWLDPEVDYAAMEWDDVGRGIRSIRPWVEDLKKGDLIFVMGGNNYNAIAIAESDYSPSGPFLNMGDSGKKPAIKVRYLHKLEDPYSHNLSTHNNPTTFADIDQYNFGLEKVLQFLDSKVPAAIEALENYLSINRSSQITKVAEQLLRRIETAYPRFEGFKDDRFIENEISYKKNIVDDATEVLSKDKLRELLDEEEYEAFRESVVNIGRHPDNNLLYKSTPRTGDLGLLHHEDLDYESFAHAFFSLLHGPETTAKRLDTFCDWVDEQGLPNKWTFVTYYLFVTNSFDELFVKPKEMKKFLELLDKGDQWQSRPTGELYSTIKSDLKAVGEALPFNTPRGFLDLQSFLWASLAAEPAKKVVKRSLPDSLNVIMYGPPGTGKTYSLHNEYSSYFTNYHKIKTKEDFETEIIEKLAWRDVIALTLLDKGKITVPKIRSHRFIHMKESVSDNNNVNAVIWAMLQTHTSPEYENVKYGTRKEPFLFKKLGNSVWAIEQEACEQKAPELLNTIKRLNNFEPVQETRLNYKFITFHQSFTYEDFVEGIKPVMDNKADSEGGDVQYEIVKGIFYQAVNEACKLAGFGGLQDCLSYDREARKEQFSQAKPYGLFIDEINRGNISAILGELITLIEEDKRLTKENELIVQLPYSKKPFAVPPNLYIVGTMNTADRSVEALDTALRRRFQFKEMAPDSEVLEDKNSGKSEVSIDEQPYSLPELLDTINKRIEKILDKDHLIGHSYLMGVNNWKELGIVFSQEIIPLLEEYFYGDKGKVQLVLGNGFVSGQNGESNDSIFPATKYNGRDIIEERIVWKIREDWKTEEAKFAEALDALLQTA